MESLHRSTRTSESCMHVEFRHLLYLSHASLSARNGISRQDRHYRDNALDATTPSRKYVHRSPLQPAHVQYVVRSIERGTRLNNAVALEVRWARFTLILNARRQDHRRRGTEQKSRILVTQGNK